MDGRLHGTKERLKSKNPVQVPVFYSKSHKYSQQPFNEQIE